MFLQMNQQYSAINLATCGDIYASMDLHITNMSHREVLKMGKNTTSLSEWYDTQTSCLGK